MQKKKINFKKNFVPESILYPFLHHQGSQRKARKGKKRKRTGNYSKEINHLQLMRLYKT